MIKSIQNTDHYTWRVNCDGWHLLKSDTLSVIQERMPHNSKEQLHYHQFEQQVFYILSGTATFEINGQEHVVSAFESIHLPKKTVHRIFTDRDRTFQIRGTIPSQKIHRKRF